MNNNLNRLWVVVNTDTSDVVYCSTQYTKAKRFFDIFVERARRKFDVFRGIDLPLGNTDVIYNRFTTLFGYKLIRYDISRSYIQEVEKVITTDVKKFLRFACPSCEGRFIASNTTNKE
jgi:hypothetical protein